LLTMPGTPFLYYGEEIGLRNGKLRYRDLRDPYTKRFWPFRPGRDPARTPMQWDGSGHAGFTTSQPWLPLPLDYSQLNVAREAADPDSLWSLYRRLIEVRRMSPALNGGEYRVIDGGPRDCLLYEREARTEAGTMERMLIAVNFSQRPSEFSLPADSSQGLVLVSTNRDAAESKWDPARIQLGPDEGRLVRLS
jgi:alpha-glucosidase